MTSERQVTIKGKRQEPVTRFVDSRLKKENREFKYQLDVENSRAILASLASQLREARYSRMARFLEFQSRIDPLSNDSRIGIRVAHLLLAGQKESAQFLMKFANGLFILDEPPSATKKHKLTPHKFTESIDGWDK